MDHHPSALEDVQTPVRLLGLARSALLFVSESFGGDASEFHDLAHPTAAASRRMLDLMLRPLPAGS